MKPEECKSFFAIKLWSFLFIFISPLTLSYSQQYGSHQEKIREIDIQIDQLLFKKKVNNRELDKLNQFSVKVGDEFEKLKNVNDEIARIEKAIQDKDYTTYGGNKSLKSELTDLQAKQQAIYQPPGGITINGEKFKNLQDLQNELVPLAKELLRLKRENGDLSQELLKLDTTRDDLVAQIPDHNQLESSRKKRIFTIEKEYYYQYISDINNPRKICWEEYSFNNGNPTPARPVCVERQVAVALIVRDYRDELNRTGGKFNKDDLVQKILKKITESGAAKESIKRNFLPGLRSKLNALQTEINSLNKPADLTILGFWELSDGSPNSPHIEIEPDGNGFKGTVRRQGWIAQDLGHVLFRVDRINETTFDGTEFSFTYHPVKKNTRIRTRIPVRLIVNQNGSSISYRTKDDMLTLYRK
jgi:hypothetical protein